MSGSPEEQVLDGQAESLIDHGPLQGGQSGAPAAAQDLDGVGRMVPHEVEGLKSDKKITIWGRGGGLVASALDFCSDNPSLILAGF